MNGSDDKNRPNVAVALHYDGDGAPRVTAKGDRLVAERILEVAREHGIPLYEEPELAALLARLELGEEIPASLYTAVAEVIAFAYRVRGIMEVGGMGDEGHGR